MKSAIVAALVAIMISVGTATAASTGLITGAQIKNGSIGLADLSGTAKRALKGQRGPRGDQGPDGMPGAPGGFDPAKLTLVDGGSYNVAPDDNVTADIYCPSTHPTPIFAGVGSYTGQVSSLIIFPASSLARIRVSNYAFSWTITFNPYVVCSAK